MKIFLVALFIVSGVSFGKTFTVMNYNVENLFDWTHDKGKLDYTYLPKKVKDESHEVQEYCRSLTVKVWRDECFNLDWSEEVVSQKMENLAKVVRASNNGVGPDILVLEEVENKNILNIFVKKHLVGMGYKYISLIEGEDERGIDVGIISKFEVKSEKLHKLELLNQNNSRILTRGILEVVYKVEGKLLTVFANHWPSQAAPSEVRYEAAKTLLQLAKKSKSQFVIATGDFNTIDEDAPHGLNEVIAPYFIDVEKEARKINSNLNPGTHWYMTEWSSLDRMFVLKSKLSKKASINYDEFKIQNFDFVVGPKKWINYETGEVTVYEGVPYRFYPQNGTGYSDHLSIISSFNLN